ncbi:LytR/AlgR family response regulator transcription factor [Chitinimonas koreensis]|uniref:LytR/AlgR family response regulator transcription factor n=1 Tax=Chitinimonas koreensis TaxID=356302 RepID=UPI0003F6E7C2|nr:LytTR family DNA-binding domain-containing protein [Chitinimonas koreensis]QNM95973.1 response regulator transcription factor [Chitinimonas koreensis]
MSIRAMVVDDEEPGRLNLRYALADFPDWQLLAECSSTAQARAQWAELPCDVVFLDIQMPGESGLALARELSTLPYPPVIVFVTAYERYAVEAFEAHALDYLLKPFDDERLARTLERSRSMLALRQGSYGELLRYSLEAMETLPPRHLSRVTVRSVGAIESIDVDDIYYLSASGNYVSLHLEHRTVLHRATLCHMATLLDPETFIRVHRSFLVRRQQMQQLRVTGDGTYALTLRNGDRVAVSGRYVQAVRSALATI